jgi:damage-control phosphatase, subfamily I
MQKKKIQATTDEKTKAGSLLYVFLYAMRIMPDCLACIIDDIKEALNLLEASRKDIDIILSEVMKYLGENYKNGEPASYYITEMHRIVKRHFNLDMPFSTLREICLASCKEIGRRVGQESMNFSGIEKLKFLIRWAVAGNALDFRAAGAGYGIATDRIERLIRDCFDSGLSVDEVDRIYVLLKKARHIVYLPDNVGELPFDKLLIAECGSYGATFTVPFRGGPITSDVVIADANAVQLEEVVDTIILSGPDTLGISFKEMTEECKIALNNADVIIAKGQANFYVLSEFGMDFPQAAIISLLATKCQCVSKLFGFNEKVNIAFVLKEANGAIKVGKACS